MCSKLMKLAARFIGQPRYRWERFLDSISLSLSPNCLNLAGPSERLLFADALFQVTPGPGFVRRCLSSPDKIAPGAF